METDLEISGGLKESLHSLEELTKRVQERQSHLKEQGIDLEAIFAPVVEKAIAEDRIIMPGNPVESNLSEPPKKVE